MMYSAYKLNKQGDNIQPQCTPFPIWNQSIVPCVVLTCFLTCIYVSQEVDQVIWYAHLFQNFPQFIVIHTIEGFAVVNKAEIDIFLELFCFFNDPANVDIIWSLVPLPFLKPAWTSGISQFMYYWSLAWRILSITLPACEMSAIVSSLSILWHCLSLGLELKLTFSSPVAIAEFSKFADIFGAALSQHHLSGFEIAQLEFHHLH